MAAPTELFLERNHIDGRWKVLDISDFPFGDGETKTDAIASAKMLCDDTPIHIAPRQIVGNPDYTTDELIDALAELAGMTVIEVFDENLKQTGYIMEVRE